MEVVGVPGCDTNQNPPTASCNAPGGTFTIRVRLNAISGLIDNDHDGAAGYTGAQARLNFSAGLTFREGRALGVWPDCVDSQSLLTPGSFLIGCVTGFGVPESSFLGPIFEVDFDCPETPGVAQIGMPLSGPTSESHVIDDVFNPVLDKGPSPETLTITCTEPPPPPPPPPISGGMAVDCNAVAPGIQSHCIYGVGTQFDIQIHLTEPPTSGFVQFGMRLGWQNPPLDYLPASNPADEALWPHCQLPSRILPAADSVEFGCVAVALPAGDTTTGPILRFRFQCTGEGQAQLSLVDGNTFLDTAAGLIVTPELSGATVICTSIPFNLKNPVLANLFLTAQGSKLPPSTCAASTNVQTYSHTISNAPTTADPKDPSLIQQIGGF
ncbi:MAG: hypothetical protein WEE64_12635, partial [Dehalococcoidia bacterium]